MSEYDDRDLAVLLDFMRKANAATREEISRMRTALEGADGGELAAPLSSVESGRLVFANVASRLTLRAGSRMDDLYTARFEGIAPKAKVEDGTVTFRRSRRFTLFDLCRHSEEIMLNAAIPWEVEVRSGAAWVKADLAGLDLTSFVLKGRASELDLALSEPSGVVSVRMSGGASEITVR